MKKYLMIGAAAAVLLSGVTATEAMAGAEGKCKACHTFEQGGKNRMGPNLFGILGKRAGSTKDYRYGKYLEGADFTWNEDAVRKWIFDSKGVAKAAGASTKMPSQKIDGAKADEVIAFLKTVK
ncbi:MAG TPA: c-type cytochrome [Mariprofundaceae bacterium]|nr:c-type cytochrome [Mariprofundaceae bacterium]